jgi:hypothetical protein
LAFPIKRFFWEASTHNDAHTTSSAMSSNAAHGRHLEVLKWARANDCPWYEWTRAKAVELGYVEDD